MTVPIRHVLRTALQDRKLKVNRLPIAADVKGLNSWRVPPLYPLTRAHEVDSATRWGRHKAAVGRFHFRSIRFGAAAIAASVSGATGSGRLGGAAAAGRRRHRGDDERVPPLYPLTRAHEGRADPATLVSRATRNQTDPLAPPAGRRRHFQNSG